MLTLGILVHTFLLCAATRLISGQRDYFPYLLISSIEEHQFLKLARKAYQRHEGHEVIGTYFS